MGKRRIKYVETTASLTPKMFDNLKDGYKQLVEKGCTSKQIYYTKKDADNAALMVRTRGQRNVYPYECLYDTHWHIGHKYT